MFGMFLGSFAAALFFLILMYGSDEHGQKK